MNILYWIILLVVVFVVHVWYKRRQHYKGLPVFERLWEDYIRTKGKEPALAIAEKKLSDYICGVFETAKDSNNLNTLKKELMSYWRDRPYEISYWCGPFSSPEMAECVEKMEDKFAEARAEANKKSEEVEMGKEAERFKAAQDATTWEEARAVLVGNYVGRASTNLAIKKMNRFSLFEVLAAKTFDELEIAKERAREDSLARKYVPFMYEKIAKSMVEHADTIDDLIAAAELAPTEALACNTALYISFLKIDSRRHQEKK